jgi:hypothetical protein
VSTQLQFKYIIQYHINNRALDINCIPAELLEHRGGGVGEEKEKKKRKMRKHCHISGDSNVQSLL